MRRSNPWWAAQPPPGTTPEVCRQEPPIASACGMALLVLPRGHAQQAPPTKEDTFCTRLTGCHQGDEGSEAMNTRRFLIALTLLAVGIAAPAWSQEVHFEDAGTCDASKAHCVSAIVFTSTRDYPPAYPAGLGEIYLMVMNDQGEVVTTVEPNPIRLADNLAGEALPALSPDGKKIVFDSNRLRAAGEPVNTSDLFLMNTDGTEQTHLIRGSSASWSPDSKYIAFHRSASGTGLPIRPDPGAPTTDSDIFIGNVDDLLALGTPPTNITDTPNDIEEDADWSPDGRRIVYPRHPANELPPAQPFNYPSKEIYVLDLETRVATRVTQNELEERAPVWSPDGTRIAFMRRTEIDGPSFEVYVMNANGTGQTRLTENPFFDATPTWSPDGTKIVVGRAVPPIPPGRQQLFTMTLNEDGTKVVHDAALVDPFPPGGSSGAHWGVLRIGGRDPK
jgi:TolB protein